MMKRGQNNLINITDDSGFIAIIEPEKYISFVGEEWDLHQLVEHFKGQMKIGNMLIWGTGGENIWNIEINHGFTDIVGYREMIGSIKVESNSLCLINYESLTMAAQFADVKLPEEHMKELLIKLDNGIYDIKIIQFYNSETDSYINRDDIDFLVEIQKVDIIGYLWDNIPWSTDL